MDEVFTKENFLKEFKDEQSANDFERDILNLDCKSWPSCVVDVLNGSKTTSDYWQFMTLTAKYVRMRSSMDDKSINLVADRVKAKLPEKRLREIEVGVERLNILAVNLLSYCSRENAALILAHSLKRWMQEEVSGFDGMPKDEVDDLDYRAVAVYWIDKILFGKDG